MNYATQPVDQLLAAVASENVTPAGGTVAAVVGAAGASLCEMVCIHTGGDGASELDTVREDLRRQRRGLLELADADAEAVASLLAVIREGDSDTEAKRATGVPLAVAEGCLTVLEAAPSVVERGNPNAVPDAVTGVLLAHAALRAAVFTVRSNLDHIEDDAFVEGTERRASEVERAAERAAERVTERVGTGASDPRGP